MSIYTEEEQEEITILLDLMDTKIAELRAWRGRPQEPRARKELLKVIRALDKLLDKSF